MKWPLLWSVLECIGPYLQWHPVTWRLGETRSEPHAWMVAVNGLELKVLHMRVCEQLSEHSSGAECWPAAPSHPSLALLGFCGSHASRTPQVSSTIRRSHGISWPPSSTPATGPLWRFLASPPHTSVAHTASARAVLEKPRPVTPQREPGSLQATLQLWAQLPPVAPPRSAPATTLQLDRLCLFLLPFLHIFLPSTLLCTDVEWRLLPSGLLGSAVRLEQHRCSRHSGTCGWKTLSLGLPPCQE